jgi:hypothetical protein
MVASEILIAVRTTGTCFIILGVLDKVLFEDPHEDGGQEARQQQHRHTRVYDTEPVDLQPEIESESANVMMTAHAAACMCNTQQGSTLYNSACSTDFVLAQMMSRKMRHQCCLIAHMAQKLRG